MKVEIWNFARFKSIDIKMLKQINKNLTDLSLKDYINLIIL